MMVWIAVILVCAGVYWGITMLQVRSIDKDIQQEKDKKKREKYIRDKYGLHTWLSRKK